MSINKIVVLAIIASAVAFEHVQPGAAQAITIDEYLGVWYDVGVMFPSILNPNPIECQWVKATKRDNDYESFNDVLTVKSRRGLEKYVGHGKMFGSKMHIKYSDAEGGTTIYEVTRFSNGKEMLLYDVNRKLSSVLVSDDPRPYAVSSEAKEAFETLAEEIGGYVHYIDNSECETAY